MGVLSALKVNLRTKLAEISGLTALPENVSIEGVPDSDKAFFSVVSEVGGTRLGIAHGGGVLVPYDGGRLIVKVAWLMDDDEEAFDDTKTDHEESINGVVQKVSNWTSGIDLVTRNGGSERTDRTLVRADLFFDVRYRVSQDVT